MLREARVGPALGGDLSGHPWGALRLHAPQGRPCGLGLCVCLQGGSLHPVETGGIFRPVLQVPLYPCVLLSATREDLCRWHQRVLPSGSPSRSSEGGGEQGQVLTGLTPSPGCRRGAVGCVPPPKVTAGRPSALVTSLRPRVTAPLSVAPSYCTVPCGSCAVPLHARGPGTRPLPRRTPIILDQGPPNGLILT